MEAYKVLIIDDERLAREVVKKYLEASPELLLVGECPNGFEGVKMIQELKPDLIFLDIQMPKLTGFEMLELLDEYPAVIFTTAYDEYAIKAFEVNAIDYLMKPFTQERFTTAIRRFLEKSRLQKPGAQEEDRMKLQSLLHYGQKQGYTDRIVVKDQSRIHIIPVDSIRYCKAEEDYILIVTAEGKYLKKHTISTLEASLDPAVFIRVHRSYIVKQSHIRRLEIMGKETYVLLLQDGSKIPVSKSGYKKLKESMDM